MREKKVLRTKICEQLGIEYPIFLAGMGFTSGPTLAAAVSNAGGLGVLGGAMLTPDEAREWIRKTKSLTDKPFGFDLILPPNIEGSNAPVDFKKLIPKEHVDFVKSLLKELDLPQFETPQQWLDFRDESMREVVKVCMDEQIAVFAAGLGDPGWVVPDAHKCGMKVMGCVGNTKNARRLKASGIDILIAQGYEGGGHTGRIGTMSVVPQIIDGVSPMPVLAAGGIVDGRGLAAALALGAEGVWIGTAFVATHEANVDIIELGKGYYSPLWDETWKKSIVESVDEDTVVCKISSGKTARHIKNKLIDIWDKSGFSYLPMPLQTFLVSDLYYNIGKSDKTEYMCSFGGQGVGLINEIKSAGDVVNDMVEEAVEILTQGIPRRVTIKN